MKKYLLLFLALFLYMGANAGNLSGVKIYINPGHGGYDGDDRNIVTIPYAQGVQDGFWESSSSLTKGLALRDLLEAHGATVVMSRVTNTTADDRNLTEIAEEANASNSDSFISIHSNGGNGVANYLLILYRGTDALPDPALGRPMAEAAWKRLVKNPLVMWSHYGEGTGQVNVRGDFSYYDYHLGVLRTNTIPGFLSEGSFHDYQPETHRFLNDDYRRLEAERFFRYYCDYFGADVPLKSVVAGTVKDKYFPLVNKLYNYKAGSDDAHKPIHGATVILKDAAGVNEIQRYVTDNKYNGVYVFYNVVPGSYKITFEATGYKSEEQDLIVKADGDMYYAKAFLTDNTVEIPVPPTYPEPTQEGGVLPQTDYKFNQLASDQPVWLNTSRKILFNGAEIYSLNDNGTVSVVNTTTNAVTKTLSAKKAGVPVLLSDIAMTSNGQLVAIEKATLSTSSTQKVITYVWEKDAEDANVLFESDYKGDLEEVIVGESMTLIGAPWNYQLYVTARAASGDVSIIAYKGKDGDAFKTSYMKTAVKGNNITMTPSPYADNQVTIDSELVRPTNFEYDWSATAGSNLTIVGTLDDANLSVESYGGTFFKYAKRIYMAMPTSDAGGANVKVVTYDVTDGLTGGVAVSSAYSETGLGSAVTITMAAAAQVSGYDITLLVAARNQGFAKYKTVAAKTLANIFASSLKYNLEGDNVYALSYVLNEAAESVEIQLVKDGSAILSKPSTGLSKGLNEVKIDISDAPAGNYAWQVKASAGSIIKPVKYTDDTKPEMQFYKPFSVAIDNNFESPHFGRVYVSETLGGSVTKRKTTPGVFILNATFDDVTLQGANDYKGGETWVDAAIPTMRMSVAPDGRVFIADATAAHSGVYVMDAANPSANFTPVFEGVREAYGLLKNGSVRLATPSVDCYVSGEGENTKLFTFDTDWLVGGAANLSNVHQYNIGTTLPHIQAPVVAYNNGSNGNLMQNKNRSFVPDRKGGWWVAQYRATDAPSVPSLIHVDAAGVVDYNSGKTPDLIRESRNGGIAISHDGKLIALGGSNRILILGVEYDNVGVPSLSVRHTITPGLGANSNSLAFDRAGNVYLVSNSNERLGAWALPKLDNSFITPAPSSFVLERKAIVENLQATSAGDAVTLRWDAIAAPSETRAAVTYNVYRDNSLLGNTAELTYVDAGLLNGTYKYVVSALVGGTEFAQSSIEIEVKTATGIDSNEIDAFRIYPNPTDGELKIEMNNEPIQSLKVFTTTGSLLVNAKYAVGKTEAVIDMTSYAEGVYLLKVNNIIVKIVKK